MRKLMNNSIDQRDTVSERPDRGKLISRIVLLTIMDALLAIFVQFFSMALRCEFQINVMLRSEYTASLLFFLPVYVVLTLLVFHLMGLYSSLWRYAGIDEAIRIVASTMIVSALQYVLMLLLGRRIPRSLPVLNAVFLSIAIGIVRFSYRILRSMVHRRSKKHMARTMLIGAGDAASVALKDLNDSETSRNKIVCIIDDDPLKQGRRMCGVPIVGGRNSIPDAARRYQVEQIILAIPSATPSQRRELAAICQSTGCETKMLPSIAQLASGRLDRKGPGPEPSPFML